jgi:hypothetical protein
MASNHIAFVGKCSEEYIYMENTADLIFRKLPICGVCVFVSDTLFGIFVLYAILGPLFVALFDVLTTQTIIDPSWTDRDLGFVFVIFGTKWKCRKRRNSSAL